MADELISCSFLHRLQTLQNLCIGDNAEDPTALLIIPGIDGRNNKESMTLMKYLLGGVVGRELLDNSVMDDALEEMVLLIQAASVSVIYSRAAKAVCGSVLSGCPHLVEYMPLKEDDDEIDTQQARKVCDFKRMMLESVPSGSVIGMSIPIGYDSVQDVESWPLLQSFALDGVICPTGFFTARYGVVDLSEYLNIAYRAVDEYCLDNAISVLKKSVLPHVSQTIALLDCPSGAQRALTSAGDAIGPLDMVYEFGELESNPSAPADNTHRPVLLFGPLSSSIGAPGGIYPKNWQDSLAGTSPHCVLEGCEPSTGIRFCRTYFLESGSTIPYLQDSEALVGLGLTGEGDVEESKVEGEIIASSAILERLKVLYVKLWLALRAVVRVAFQSHTDVLEAGSYIQTTMDLLMKGKAPEGGTLDLGLGISGDPHLSKIMLNQNERLQVHMDCMNSLGEVISIEDVDDIGGSCFTYIRVSVHGVPLGGGEAGAVCVGDTFLFSVAKKIIAEGVAPMGGKGVAPPSLLSDSVCLTHAVPYYRCLLGVGAEDRSAQRFLACIRNPHMLHALGLGDPIDVLSSSSSSRGFESSAVRGGANPTSVLSVPVLTDHPLTPLLTTEIKFFTSGFVIEKCHTVSLPMMVSMEQHVAEMWTLDPADCLVIAQQRGLLSQYPDRNVPRLSAPEGLLVVLRLKKIRDYVEEAEESKDAVEEVKRAREEKEGDEEEEEEEEEERYAPKKSKYSLPDSTADSIRKAMMFNPLKRSLSPFCASSSPSSSYSIEPECVAIFAPTGSRVSSALSSALVTWRAALKAQGVPEHKGGGKRLRTTPSKTQNEEEIDGSLPLGILRAFVTAIDTYSVADTTGQGSSLSFGLSREGSMGLEDMIHDESIPVSSSTILAASAGLRGVPGTGFLAMRCAHSLSESIRMQFPPHGLQNSLAQYSETASKGNVAASAVTMKLLVVVGFAGSGVQAVGGLIKRRLGTHEGLNRCPVGCVEINLTDIVAGEERRSGSEFLSALEGLTASAFSAVSTDRTFEKSSVVVVVVTSTAENYIPQSDLFRHITASVVKWCPGVAVSLAAVVSVVAPKAMLCSSITGAHWKADSPVYQGSFGLELHRSCVTGLCQAGVCDIAMLVDSVSSVSVSEVYSDFRQWVQAVNPSASVVRINPTMLRLEEDTVDTLISLLAAKGECSARSFLFSVRYSPLPATGPERDLLRPLRVRQSNRPEMHTFPSGLYTLSIPAPTSKLSAQPAWSLRSVVTVLQLLFPLASVSVLAASLTDTWQPSTHSSRGFKHLIDLARVKVFTARRCEEERKELTETLSLLKKKGKKAKEALKKGEKEGVSDLAVLKVGLLSVCGLVCVGSDVAFGSDPRHGQTDSSHRAWVSIETSAGAIIIKDYKRNHATTSSESQSFTAQGSFVKASRTLLLELFQACKVLHLSPKPLLTHSEVTTRMTEKAQLKFCGVNHKLRPLPGGWWFDGNVYLDLGGNQRRFRPDIDEILDLYLEELNEEISKYNAILEEIQLYL